MRRRARDRAPVHRASYQLGWQIGREDFDTEGRASDALSAWNALYPEHKRRAPDLMSFTRGYTRGGFMTPKSAAYEIRRSESYLARRVQRALGVR